LRVPLKPGSSGMLSPTPSSSATPPSAHMPEPRISEVMPPKVDHTMRAEPSKVLVYPEDRAAMLAMASHPAAVSKAIIVSKQVYSNARPSAPTAILARPPFPPGGVCRLPNAPTQLFVSPATRGRVPMGSGSPRLEQSGAVASPPPRTVQSPMVIGASCSRPATNSPRPNPALVSGFESSQALVRINS